MFREAVFSFCPWRRLVLFHQLCPVCDSWECTLRAVSTPRVPGGGRLLCNLVLTLGCRLFVSSVCLHCLHSPSMTSSGSVVSRVFLLRTHICKPYLLLNLRLFMISLPFFLFLSSVLLLKKL